jgi:hypothetical protein
MAASVVDIDVDVNTLRATLSMTDPLAHVEAPAADLTLVVAPGDGRLRLLPTGARVVPAGGVLGHVSGPAGREELRCPADAVMEGVLARPGEAIARGQVVAWGRRCRLEAMA